MNEKGMEGTPRSSMVFERGGNCVAAAAFAGIPGIPTTALQEKEPEDKRRQGKRAAGRVGSSSPPVPPFFIFWLDRRERGRVY